MRHFNKERIKSIAIFGLLLTSLIQVGILWGYQSQGTPTSFFRGILGWGNKEITSDEAREDLFIPYRLIISDGSGSHWLVNRQDRIFKEIIGEAGGYLKSIAEGRLERLKTPEEWGNISTKQGFILEFKAAIEPDLLKWFTGASKVSGDAPSISKMLIKPDIVNKSLCEIYILSPGGELSKYAVNNVERPQSMEDMLAVYENNENAYRNYVSMRDNNLDKFKPFSPDILYVVKPPMLWPYYQLQAAAPVRAARDNELAEIMLGSERDRFIKTDYSGFLQFSNRENIYKVYDDGYLSYKYLADASTSEKGAVGDALKTAYVFISKLNRLTNMKADIYLSGIDASHQGYYTFRFDYKLNGMPVFINLQSKGKDGGSVENAITISASGKRVLQCGWMLRDFAQGQKSLYNDRFDDVMANVKYGDMAIVDIATGYYLNSAEEGIFSPSLIIQEKGKQSVSAYILPAGKGE